jgi:hypothetical protein
MGGSGAHGGRKGRMRGEDEARGYGDVPDAESGGPVRKLGVEKGNDSQEGDRDRDDGSRRCGSREQESERASDGCRHTAIRQIDKSVCGDLPMTFSRLDYEVTRRTM